MTTSMVTQDADTFVELGRAMSLAAEEGALDRDGARNLTAALVAAILTGCMELDTYAQVHEALAKLLEVTFRRDASRERPPSEPGTLESSPGADDSLGVYLEVVGEAWDKVNGEEEVCARVRHFALSCFDLERSHFGGESWFQGPLRVPVEELVRCAKAAGLMVVSVQPPESPDLVAFLVDPAQEPVPSEGRVVLGWGERRATLSLAPTG